MLLKTIEDIFYENLAHNFSEYLYFDIWRIIETN
jgi:hypothetical protein